MVSFYDPLNVRRPSFVVVARQQFQQYSPLKLLNEIQ